MKLINHDKHLANTSYDTSVCGSASLRREFHSNSLQERMCGRVYEREETASLRSRRSVRESPRGGFLCKGRETGFLSCRSGGDWNDRRGAYTRANGEAEANTTWLRASDRGLSSVFHVPSDRSHSRERRTVPFAGPSVACSHLHAFFRSRSELTSEGKRRRNVEGYVI